MLVENTFPQSIFVTGFAKTVPNGTRIEIQFIAEFKPTLLHYLEIQTHSYRWPNVLSLMTYC